MMSRLFRTAHVRSLLLPLALLAAVVTVAASAQPRTHARFPSWTPYPGLSAEGVVVDRAGHVYVTVREGNNGVILRYSRAGDVTHIADLGPGMIGGLAIAPDGDLYAAVAAGAGQGVYRISRHGIVSLVPGSDRIAFANALAFDRRGTLYITESYSLAAGGGYGPGGIWRAPRGREAEPWLRHPLLTGVGAVLGYPVGANGIAIYRGDLFVVNTDKALVVRVPITRHDRPGTPDVWATIGEVPESPLAGNPAPPLGDGIAIDRRGDAYVAVVSRCSIVRIDAEEREQETVAFLQFGPPDLPLNAPLDTPASLAFGPQERELFVTNLGMMSAMAPGPPWPGAGLVKIDLGSRER